MKKCRVTVSELVWSSPPLSILLKTGVNICRKSMWKKMFPQFPTLREGGLTRDSPPPPLPFRYSSTWSQNVNGIYVCIFEVGDPADEQGPALVRLHLGAGGGVRAPEQADPQGPPLHFRRDRYKGIHRYYQAVRPGPSSLPSVKKLYNITLHIITRYTISQWNYFWYLKLLKITKKWISVQYPKLLNQYHLIEILNLIPTP